MVFLLRRKMVHILFRPCVVGDLGVACCTVTLINEGCHRRPRTRLNHGLILTLQILHLLYSIPFTLVEETKLLARRRQMEILNDGTVDGHAHLAVRCAAG